MTQSFIDIDGSFGEGGGQIVRSSLALSLLTGKAFRIRNVRAGRDKPGLQPQHLLCVRAAASIGQAKVQGDTRGSTSFSFEPGQTTPGKYHFAVGTAGATSLVLHTLYLPLARAGQASEVTIDGGTHVTKSPCYHFLETTWAAYLRLLGLNIKLRMKRSGFYPRGGGLIHAEIEPAARLHGLKIAACTPPTHATGFSAVANLPEHIARRQAERAAKRLAHLNLKTDIREEKWPHGMGTVIAVALDTTPAPTLFFALGQRGKPADRVADELVDQVETFLDAETPGVDAHTADQLVLPLALAEGTSRYPVSEVTLHLLTNIAVVRLFVERDIACEGDEGKPGVVRIG